MMYKEFLQLWSGHWCSHPALLQWNHFRAKLSGGEMRVMTVPGKRATGAHRSCLKLGSFCINKHFSICRLPLVNFQGSEIVILTISPSFLVVLRKRWTSPFTPPCQKLLAITCYVMTVWHGAAFSAVPARAKVVSYSLGWRLGHAPIPEPLSGQWHTTLWLAKAEWHTWLQV